MPYNGRPYRGTRRPVRRGTRAPARRRTTAPLVTKAVRRARTTAFNARVQRAIRPMMETKTVIFPIFASTDGLSGANIPGAGLFTPATNTRGLKASNLLNNNYLELSKGTGSYQRVGNKVQNCKLRVRGFVKTNDTTLSNNLITMPYYVHIIAYKKKVDPSGDVMEMIKLPNNTVSYPSYSTRDQLMPFNRNAYIIKRVKRFKLRPPVQTLDLLMDTENDAYEAPMNQQQSNAPICRFFSMDIPIAKTLLYDNQTTVGAAHTPNNDWISLAAYVSLGDGSDFFHGYTACQIYADGIFTFTDA